MQIKNPQTLTFPNGDGLPIDLSLNTLAEPGFAVLDVNSHGSGGAAKDGQVQLQTEANGDVTLVINLDPASPVHVKVFENATLVFEG